MLTANIRKAMITSGTNVNAAKYAGRNVTMKAIAAIIRAANGNVITMKISMHTIGMKNRTSAIKTRITTTKNNAAYSNSIGDASPPHAYRAQNEP